MSLLTEVVLLERYGPRVTMAELGEILKIAQKTVTNRLAAGTLPLKTFNDSGRFCNTDDVAAYIESFR